MEQIKAKAVGNGAAIGTIYFKRNQATEIIEKSKLSPELELDRYQKARTVAIDGQNQLFEKAKEEVGEEQAQIFEAHIMMLEDEEMSNNIEDLIRSDGVTAEYAVNRVGTELYEQFTQMDDDYFKARAVDIKDIIEVLILALQGKGDSGKLPNQPVIVVADDLTPSETLQMDKKKLLGFATRLGSSNSHTAILARTLNIPALVEVPINPAWNGLQAVIDGEKGLLILEPDKETIERYERIIEKQNQYRHLLLTLRDEEDVTRSGKRMQVFANIGSSEDIPSVIENGAAGIGLFRTEFIFLGRDNWPSEEEQFLEYKKVAQAMGKKKVIIRTLDFGADKQVAYANMDKEENPALGMRAIRICLTRPEVFKTQLRALYRASAFGNIAIMYPMIISVDEVRLIKAHTAEVRAQLDFEGIHYGEVQQGIMIETPASAVISAELAREVDFFSIGTNDLTQYTLAADRQNSKLNPFIDIHHPAVIQLIRLTAESAHKAGIEVGICGELGADTSLTQFFLEIGIDEVSMSPASILPVRKIIRETE